jgi:hypothetical protein
VLLSTGCADRDGLCAWAGLCYNRSWHLAFSAMSDHPRQRRASSSSPVLMPGSVHAMGAMGDPVIRRAPFTIKWLSYRHPMRTKKVCFVALYPAYSAETAGATAAQHQAGASGRYMSSCCTPPVGLCTQGEMTISTFNAVTANTSTSPLSGQPMVSG